MLPSKMRNMDSRHLDGFFPHEICAKSALRSVNLRWPILSEIGHFLHPGLKLRFSTKTLKKSAGPAELLVDPKRGVFWTSLPCFDVLSVDQSEAMKSILPNSCAAFTALFGSQNVVFALVNMVRTLYKLYRTKPADILKRFVSLLFFMFFPAVFGFCRSTAQKLTLFNAFFLE